MNTNRKFMELNLTARDGYNLKTDIYTPCSEEPSPVILLRTAYGRRQIFLLKLAQRLTDSGFGVLLQDIRRSPKGFDRTIEEHDNYDTLEWLANQSWCNGKLGVIGISFSSIQAFMIASQETPPGIKVCALINLMGNIDTFSCFYRSGALIQHWALPWSLMVGDGTGRTNDLNSICWEELFSCLPLSELEKMDLKLNPLWSQALSRRERDAFWSDYDVRSYMRKLNVPVLHLGGLYDFMLPQVLEAFQFIERQCHTCCPNHLVLGPWDHQEIYSSFIFKPGSQSYSDAKTSINLFELLVYWFKSFLVNNVDEPNRIPSFALSDKVLAFIMGEESWTYMDQFPPNNSDLISFYLSSSGQAANSVHGGRLVSLPAANESSDSYLYDPLDPVPTKGGAIWPFHLFGLRPGAADQTEIEQRPDVLVYTSELLDRDLYIIGPVFVELWVASSVSYTDFTAKLVDVSPDGTPRIILDGIQRCDNSASHHSSDSSQYRIEPFKVLIDLSSTCHCFRKHHRIRLEVSSSNFPKYDRNPNTSPAKIGKTRPTTVVRKPSMILDSSAMILASQVPSRKSGSTNSIISALQTIYHGGTRPSRLLMSTLKRSQISALLIPHSQHPVRFS